MDVIFSFKKLLRIFDDFLYRDLGAGGLKQPKLEPRDLQSDEIQPLPTYLNNYQSKNKCFALK